jgi:hypothetical protein
MKYHRGQGVYGDTPNNRVTKLHRLSRTNSHRSWIAMMQRCYNKNAHNYGRYGGAGIGVCERWHQFANFYADMGERPDGYSLDRLDLTEDYAPGNCRWATPREQARNKSNNLLITIRGVTRSLVEWSELSGINYHTLHARLRRGCPHSQLLRPRGEF